MAKKKGKHFGRTKAEITQEFIDAYNDWKQGKITALYAMKKCNMTSLTFYRAVKRYEDKE